MALDLSGWVVDCLVSWLVDWYLKKERKKEKKQKEKHTRMTASVLKQAPNTPFFLPFNC